MTSTGAPLTDAEVARIRRRSNVILIIGQALAGIGMGGTFSAGALIMADVSGSNAWSGMAATMATVGAALAAVPLAALARRRGRATALATGAGLAAAGAAVGLAAVVLGLFPLLLAGTILLGVGTAVNLQSRFAATDLSEPRSRGRDLAIVVWASTIGAVAGPNLIEPGDAFGRLLGLPELSGVYLFTVAAQVLAAVFYLLALRPDPLRVAQRLGVERPTAAVADVPEHRLGVRVGILATALSHATMVSVMAMTPVHLVDHGATLVIVGITISLHVAGMFALSPIFGWLADRVGRAPVIALGQAVFVASLLMTALGSESHEWVLAGLILLGVGWSASTVAGSALIAESAGSARRTTVQGRADLLMNVAGAVGGASAGPVLTLIGYSGLSWVVLILTAIVLGALAVYRARPRPATV